MHKRILFILLFLCIALPGVSPTLRADEDEEDALFRLNNGILPSYPQDITDFEHIILEKAEVILTQRAREERIRNVYYVREPFG